MLRIDRDRKSLTSLQEPTLAQSAISERYDLQEFIVNSPDVFFHEIGQDLFLLGKEIVVSPETPDRLDILAVDPQGACVIVELKRGNHKLHMLQVLSYAGMISEWSAEECVGLLDEQRRQELDHFLKWEVSEVNSTQRIILLAESYDYALLSAARWLTESFGVDVRCCRIALARDTASNAEYLICSSVHPAPELADHAVARGRKRSAAKESKWSSWDEALATVANQDVVAFYLSELDKGRENYLPRRSLRYRVDGKRRWFVGAKTGWAYVWQEGRFVGDQEYWTRALGHDAEIEPVAQDNKLRFRLSSRKQLDAFLDAATEKCGEFEWTE